MIKIIQLHDIIIEVTRKKIKNLHLKVLHPDGKVTISAPLRMSFKCIYDFALSKLEWIQTNQQKILEKKPLEKLKYLEGELLEILGDLITKWEPIMNVKVQQFSIRKMKTRWGSCSHHTGKIRFNLELAKYSLECIEYVVIHEMVHLLEPSHNHRFKTFMTQFMPEWRLIRAQLKR